MGIPTVARRGLSTQDLACCDYFRTPVKNQGSDIFVFVGDGASLETEFIKFSW
jgi:hypothetical protein